MMTLKPIHRATLSEQAASQIMSRISGDHWKPGQKLPSESELCQALNVGRSTLREALKSLAFIGVVRMRPGDGTYVAEGPARFLHRVFAHGLLNTEKDVRDLCETRIVLETQLAGLCAQRAAEEDLQRLDQLVQAMQQFLPQGGETFLQLDLEFHLTIAAASKNQVLAELLRTIRELLQELIMKSQQLPGAPDLARNQHNEILQALKQRSASKARQAMLRHLQTFQRGYALLLRAAESASPVPENTMSLAERP